MIIDEIAQLRKKLETQIGEQRPFTQIYKTSIEIDKLLVKYYEERRLAKNI